MFEGEKYKLLVFIDIWKFYNSSGGFANLDPGLILKYFQWRIRKIFVEQKIFCRTTFFLDKGILRSSQSETFKKGHKINTGVFYTKKANFFPMNVLYKKFQDFELKNE